MFFKKRNYHFGDFQNFLGKFLNLGENFLFFGNNFLFFGTILIRSKLNIFYIISNVFDWAPLPHRDRPWTWPWPWPSRDNPETVCINHFWSLDAGQITVTVTVMVTVSHDVVTEPSQKRQKSCKIYLSY